MWWDAATVVTKGGGCECSVARARAHGFQITNVDNSSFKASHDRRACGPGQWRHCVFRMRNNSTSPRQQHFVLQLELLSLIATADIPWHVPWTTGPNSPCSRILSAALWNAGPGRRTIHWCVCVSVGAPPALAAQALELTPASDTDKFLSRRITYNYWPQYHSQPIIWNLAWLFGT